MKQVQLANMLYSGDNNDSLPGNEGHPFKGGPILGVAPNNPMWVAGSFATLANPSSAPAGAGTNVFLLGVLGDTDATLGQLTGSIGNYAKNAGVYHCPADQSLDLVVKKPHIRSCSANGFVGTTRDEANMRPDEVNYLYKIFWKSSDFTRISSSDVFVYVDENPTTINDGFFRCVPDRGGWGDFPAVNHNNASSFSFADGHAEIKKWRSSTSYYPVKYAYPATKPFDAAGQADFQWYRERTGMVGLNGVSYYGY